MAICQVQHMQENRMIGEVSTTPMRILKLVVRIDKIYNSGDNWTYTLWSIGKIYY